MKHWLNFFVGIGFAMILSGCGFKPIELNRVDDIKIDSMKKGELKGTIILSIHNPNSFSVKVTSADFDIWKDNTNLGTATLQEGFRISANSTEAYPVKLKADVSSLLNGGIMGILNMFGGKNPKVKLKGEIHARAFMIPRTIPIELETELPISDLNF